MIEDFTSIRLSLFFFDEKVSNARQSLVYLDQNQGGDKNFYEGSDRLFDFGRSRESFIKERQLIR